jgi:hypothetical protein
VGSTTNQAATADFNGDGKLDLAISNYNSSSVSILLGNGDGTFQTHVDYATGSGPGGVSVADVNSDHRVDLLIPNYLAGTLSVLLGSCSIVTLFPNLAATGFVRDRDRLQWRRKPDLAVDCACGNAATRFGYSGAISTLLGNAMARSVHVTMTSERFLTL